MRARPVFVIALLALGVWDGMRAEEAKPEATKAAVAYPLDTCIVSGEKLGEMGDPYVFTHEGRKIKLCCKRCIKKFNADPAKYLKKLDEAAAKKAQGGDQKVEPAPDKNEHP